MIPRRKAHAPNGETESILSRCRAGDTGDPSAIPKFEAALAEFLGVADAITVSSGRLGMRLILEQLGVGPDDEVIVPAYTLGALMPLIRSIGATPVPADVDRDTFNMMPDRVRARIGTRTRAIMALHAFGAPAEIDALAALAQEHGLGLIEDCAHSLGATFHGQATGTFGDAGFFSLETNKPLNTYGGGVVVSRDPSVADRIRASVRAMPIRTDNVMNSASGVQTEARLFRSGLGALPLFALANPITRGAMERLYRLVRRVPSAAIGYTPLQAEIGLSKLDGLEARNRARAERAQRLIDRLDARISPQRVLPDATSVYQMLVVRLPRPSAGVRFRLLLRGVDAGVQSEIADACGEALGYSDCTNAAELFRNNLMLPLYDDITDAEIDRMACAVNAAV